MNIKKFNEANRSMAQRAEHMGEEGAFETAPNVQSSRRTPETLARGLGIAKAMCGVILVPKSNKARSTRFVAFRDSERALLEHA
ncbi:MAG: hypothetical protein ACREV5_03160 [Steroidobacter sp.]